MRYFALFLALPLCAQVQDESPAPVRTYNLLRENDHWSFLADPSLRSDFWDSIKHIQLGCEGCYVSLGGETREAFEQAGNDNWGKQRYMNAFPRRFNLRAACTLATSLGHEQSHLEVFGQ
jgi:hypothetical protein